VSSTDAEPIVIHPYDPSWPALFHDLAQRLRAELGALALRIDHIGSTAVPGLAAKPIIDVQISVAALEPVATFRQPLEASGLRYSPNNPERTKRYFREQQGDRRTHVHVRRAGSFSEQFALLFRDYLRAHDADAARYAEHKHKLARRHRNDRDGYVAAKTPHIWEVIRRADAWAQRIGWEPPRSDA
jgi:GrpB-like predicted nucleotidyltransferase (UPF0157 family)